MCKYLYKGLVGIFKFWKCMYIRKGLDRYKGLGRQSGGGLKTKILGLASG